MQIRTKELRGSPAKVSSAAFTFCELLATLAVVLVLVLLQLPAMARFSAGGQTAVCQANMSALIRAWQLYAADSNDKLMFNYHGTATAGMAASALGPGWVTGWQTWGTDTDNTNTLYLTNSRYSRLAIYLNGPSLSVFKCPTDTFISPIQESRGWTRRGRSYSMNICVGGGNGQIFPSGPPYKQIRNMSEFLHPAPSENWVFLEEHADSMNEGAFFNPNEAKWVDAPAQYHDGSTIFAFADGRTEIHRWSGSLATPAARRVHFTNGVWSHGQAGDPDIHWMSYRAGRVSEASF